MANKKYDKIGDKIFELRKVKDMSQDDLAKKVGVSRQAIMKWEANQVNPKADKLQRLCDSLDVEIDFLLSKKETLDDRVENDCEVMADAEVVCEKAIVDSEEESISQPINTQDITAKSKTKRKKLSKKAKITILAIVISICLLISIILLIVNIFSQPQMSKGGLAQESSDSWHFDMRAAGWVIFGISIAIALILGIILVCRKIRNKKYKNKEINDSSH